MAIPARRWAAALLLLAACPAPRADAAEQRCGWLQNPTPANWWLDDRDGSWTLMTQGSGKEPAGMDLIPDLTRGEWIRTNGSYGHGCACLVVEIDRAERRITRISAVRQLPLARCRADRDLPKP